MNEPKNCKGCRSGSGLFSGIILATAGKEKPRKQLNCSIQQTASILFYYYARPL
jgi:hypothetical protein